MRRESSSASESAEPSSSEMARRSCCWHLVRRGFGERQLFVRRFFVLGFGNFGDQLAATFQCDGEDGPGHVADFGQQRFNIFRGERFAVVGLAEFDAFGEEVCD